MTDDNAGGDYSPADRFRELIGVMGMTPLLETPPMAKPVDRFAETQPGGTVPVSVNVDMRPFAREVIHYLAQGVQPIHLDNSKVADVLHQFVFQLREQVRELHAMVQSMQAIVELHGAPPTVTVDMQPLADALERGLVALSASQERHADMIRELANVLSAPKEVVTTGDRKVVRVAEAPRDWTSQPKRGD
jgi:hypothetical protein